MWVISSLDDIKILNRPAFFPLASFDGSAAGLSYSHKLGCSLGWSCEIGNVEEKYDVDGE